MLAFRGDLSVKHSNDDNDSKFKTHTLYLTLKRSVLVLEANKVTSIPSKNTKQVVNKISEIYDNMQVVKQAAKKLKLFMTSQNGDSKVMNIYDIKSVRYNGLRALKIAASFGELSATGQFASNAIDDLYAYGDGELSFTILAHNSRCRYPMRLVQMWTMWSYEYMCVCPGVRPRSSIFSEETFNC
jgi:hypothetical protein